MKLCLFFVLLCSLLDLSMASDEKKECTPKILEIGSLVFNQDDIKKELSKKSETVTRTFNLGNKDELKQYTYLVTSLQSSDDFDLLSISNYPNSPLITEVIYRTRVKDKKEYLFQIFHYLGGFKLKAISSPSCIEVAFPKDLQELEKREHFVASLNKEVLLETFNFFGVSPAEVATDAADLSDLLKTNDSPTGHSSPDQQSSLFEKINASFRKIILKYNAEEYKDFITKYNFALKIFLTLLSGDNFEDDFGEEVLGSLSEEEQEELKTATDAIEAVNPENKTDCINYTINLYNRKYAGILNCSEGKLSDEYGLINNMNITFSNNQ